MLKGNNKVEDERGFRTRITHLVRIDKQFCRFDLH